MYIAFLSLNTLLFTDKSDDLWYPAHDAMGRIATQYSSSGSPIAYYSDEPVSPMGLVAQHQFCRPDLSIEERCTPLSSWLDAHDAAASTPRPITSRMISFVPSRI